VYHFKVMALKCPGVPSYGTPGVPHSPKSIGCCSQMDFGTKLLIGMLSSQRDAVLDGARRCPILLDDCEPSGWPRVLSDHNNLKTWS